MNKKGSTSVFLVFLLAAMIALTMAFAAAAKHVAFLSYGDGLLNLAGRSVLSEFDLNLKDRYGLFAFEKSGNEIKRDIDYYTAYSCNQESELRFSKMEIELESYSLGNTEILKKQILDHMKAEIGITLPEHKRDQTASDKRKKDRTLRNDLIIRTLPSAPLKKSEPGFVQRIEEIKSKMGELEKVFQQNTETYLVNQYILRHFKSLTGGPLQEDTFFENEVEYILEGNYSNKENKAEVRRGLVVLRSALNAVHLYTDPQKRAQTWAAAELLTPGPAAPLTQAAIVGTWALAEAENDACLLEKGKSVALFKNRKTWATDLDSILHNRNYGCIDTGSDKGMDYEDYLMIFLYFQNENVKLMRMMDLIQINMKGTCYKDFTINFCHAGYGIRAEINSKERYYGNQY